MPTLTQEESKALAHNIVEALVVKLSDERVVEALAAVWGNQLDQWIGRGIRRMAFYVLIAALMAGVVKFHVWDLMFK